MNNKKEVKTIKFIDLFAGIGGFHQALKNVVEKNLNWNSKCVFVSEIDKNAIETYVSNFDFPKEKIINIRDIKNHKKEVPNHNFLFAGFPCQTFSNAGNKKGFLDEIRGTLFFEIVKIIKAKKPKYFILENVKHLTNHDNGKTWKLIIKTLRKLKYIVNYEPLIISPHQFKIPQERQRVFIVGVLKDKSIEKYNGINFDKILNSDNLVNINRYISWKKIKKYIEKKFLEKDVDKKYYLNKNNEKDKYMINVLIAWGEFIKKIKTLKKRTIPVIWLKEFLDVNYDIEHFPKWKQKYIQDMRNIYHINKIFIDKWIKKYNVFSWNKREQKLEWQAGKDIKDIKDSFIQLRQSGIRCKRPIKFPTLVAMVQIPIIFDREKNKWRKLTPRETSNLQSFPKSFKIFSDINSDKKADFYSYKQFGNSINVDIVSKIQEYILKDEIDYV